MSVTGVKNLVVSDEEVTLVLSLLDEFVEGGEELVGAIASDQTFLPVANFLGVDETLEGLTTMMTITDGVHRDIERARRLRRMLRCQ